MKRILLITSFLALVIISCGQNENEKPDAGVSREFNSFVFVGMINNKPGLYKYSSVSNSYSEFWSNHEEEVVELSYSNNHSSAFFVTATKAGKEGIFPFIKNAKLYVIPDSSTQPKFIKAIGSGLQVFSRWESEIVFRIVTNSWDKKISTYINQTTTIFNIYGKVLQEETKTFDVTRDGYPRLPRTKPDSLSPSGKFQLSFNTAKADSIILKKEKDKSRELVAIVDKPVNEISWSDSRKYFFVSTLDLLLSNNSIFTNQPNTSSIYIYSIDQSKVVKEWTGGGYKNFFTINDFLIFDDGFGKKSSIYIYNFETGNLIKQIKIKNGCGLNEIPEVPRFGV